MKFKEVLGRITGFSVPVFGVSWNPPEPENLAARRVLSFLEDRRVLYNPHCLEVEGQCVQSVLEIRRFLTEEIGRLADGSKLADHLRGIRAVCRKFLDDLRDPRFGGRGLPTSHEARFFTVLGELRGGIRLHVAAIAVMHGLDVKGDLASLLPQENADDADATSNTALQRPVSRVTARAKKRTARATRSRR